MELSQPSDESKVLVIYTGGTIGMLVGQQGYVPEPYFLTETLRSQHRFHDPLEESLFSHSASVEGFREWSGRATPTAGSLESRPSSPIPEGRPHTKHHPLLVRSSRPIGESDMLSAGAAAAKDHHSPRYVACSKVGDNLFEAHLPSLVTPRTATHGSNTKRIRYAILEVRPIPTLPWSYALLTDIGNSGILCWTVVTSRLTVTAIVSLVYLNTHAGARQTGYGSRRRLS